MPVIMAGSRSKPSTTIAVITPRDEVDPVRRQNCMSLRGSAEPDIAMITMAARHGLGQPLERRRQEGERQNHQAGQQDVAHLRLGPGCEGGGGLRQAAADRHAAQRPAPMLPTPQAMNSWFGSSWSCVFLAIVWRRPSPQRSRPARRRRLRASGSPRGRVDAPWAGRTTAVPEGSWRPGRCRDRAPPRSAR